jgi:hypothetical protein
LRFVDIITTSELAIERDVYLMACLHAEAVPSSDDQRTLNAITDTEAVHVQFMLQDL